MSKENENGENKTVEIMPLDAVLKNARFRSTPAPFVNFFYGLKRPPFNVLRLSNKCAKDMDIDLELFTNFLDEVIIDLQILKPLAEEAYNINKLIKEENKKEISPELEALFKESSKLTLWIMSCYSIYPKRYFQIVRECCVRKNEIINIPARGMIQFLLIKTLGLILSWMIIQSHAICIIDIEQKINSVPSTLTPLVDQIYNGKYLLLANTMIKKTCLWYKLLYQYSYKIPCADDHLSLDWEDYFREIKLELPSRCSPFRAQCGPFRVFDLITQFDPQVIYFRLEKNKDLTSKAKKDYPFKMMHIFGNNCHESDEESDFEHVKNTIARTKKQMAERQCALSEIQEKTV